VLVWILLGIGYVAHWILFGLSTFRRGQYAVFRVGFIFPIQSVVGVFVADTAGIPARRAGQGEPTKGTATRPSS